MAEGRRKSFLCEPVEICDPGVGAIVGAKPGYQPLYRNVYIFTADPGPGLLVSVCPRLTPSDT